MPKKCNFAILSNGTSGHVDITTSKLLHVKLSSDRDVLLLQVMLVGYCDQFAENQTDACVVSISIKATGSYVILKCFTTSVYPVAVTVKTIIYRTNIYCHRSGIRLN